jgi:saccharopine dehydrogenase-like NADP-dependent oxidoreductase
VRKVANQRIGIVGGYGRVGLETARHLIKTTDYDIVIGGRSIRKADEKKSR